MNTFVTFIIFIISELFVFITGLFGVLFLATIAAFNMILTLFLDYPFISLGVIVLMIFFVFVRNKNYE